MMKKKMTSSLDVILSSRLFMAVILLTVCSPDGSTAADVRNHKDVGSTSANNKLITSTTATTGPSFDKSLPLNVTVQYGAHAHLVCRVQDVANKSVSWIRKKDGHLLTVDTDTFIGDGRFQVRHPVHSDTWTLHLRGARATDAGVYECQVSSEPKMSLFYQVNVVVPEVEIRGAPDIYVMAGSGVALHCVISGLLETPPFIFWYHKTERIAGSAVLEEITRSDYEKAVKDAFVPAQSSGGATKSGWSARVTRLDADSLLAVLNVPPATADFAGNYSCGSPSLQMASVTLHVLNGEQPAAMQHGNKNSAGSDYWNKTVLALLTLLLMTAWASVEAADSTVFIAAGDEVEDDSDVDVDGNDQRPVLRCQGNAVRCS